MPCWSGSVNEVLKMVLLAVWVRGRRESRWKGESMVNSSWRTSVGGRFRGWRWSKSYSESSIENV